MRHTVLGSGVPYGLYVLFEFRSQHLEHVVYRLLFEVGFLNELFAW